MALIEWICGIDRDIMAEDYHRSEEYLRPGSSVVREDNAQVSPSLQSPPPPFFFQTFFFPRNRKDLMKVSMRPQHK